MNLEERQNSYNREMDSLSQFEEPNKMFNNGQPLRWDLPESVQGRNGTIPERMWANIVASRSDKVNNLEKLQLKKRLR